ncbi:MAG: 2'-5' RNA ligase family protein [Flavobacteriales bacterium]|nr:2'-5' RNA ligase family protein [Flavobacteriales bacterium]
MEKVSKPIIIAFGFDCRSEEELKILNRSTQVEKGIDFNEVIPHLTLWMGFIRSSQIESLELSLRKVFYNPLSILKSDGLEIFKGVDGSVLSLNVERTRELELLQNRIHHFFEPFRENVKYYEGMSMNTLEYINNFQDKSLERYDPHVTIGFADSVNGDFSNSLNMQSLSMFEAGNYCTCINRIQ